jgi:AcrR family transcriptional regulator
MAATKRITPTPDKGRRIRGLDAAERADQRRDLLLDAALDLFAREGYAGTSIEALCQRAYVGNKAFYEHFSTKEACYLELLQRNTHTIVDKVTAALDQLPADEEAGTRLVLTAFTEALLDDPRVAAITFGQSGGISPTIERQRRANRRQSAGIVLAVWGHYDGRRRPAKRAEAMAIAVVGGLFDQISDALDRTDQAPTASDVERLIDDMTDFALTVRAGIGQRRR